MKNFIQKFRYCFKKCAHLSLIALLVSMGSGCASTRKSTKTETTVSYPNAVVVSEGQQKSTIVETSSTSTASTETKAENPGVLSSTLHAIGYVLILPFLIVGGVIRIIFGG